MQRRHLPAFVLLSTLAACGGSDATSEASADGDGGAPGSASGPSQGAPGHVPTDCPNAARDGYSILDDKAYGTYQIRKVGDVKFARYEPGTENVVSEDYQVITALPKRYVVSEALQGKTFPTEERDGYYVVDSNYAIPNIPCVTDDVVYAPIVEGFSKPTITANGQNKGWPIQQDIAAEVTKYEGKNKNWVYTTWPGYRYGYWFRDETDIRPTWLFSNEDSSFRLFTPAQQGWPGGAYNDVAYGLHIDSSGKVYVPKPQSISFPQRKDQPPPPADVRLAYKDWDDDLKCVVINKSSAIIASTRTIWPGGSEAYYPAESFLPGYAVIGQDSDRYWGLKGKETDEASWWPGDDCVGPRCSGQSRMPFRNGCSIDGFDFGQGDGFNWLELKDHMAQIGVTIPREQMYRIQIYKQDRPDQPARMMVELFYEQDGQGKWQPRMKPGTNTYQLTTGDNPRYIVNGHIYDGQRVFAVLLDM